MDWEMRRLNREEIKVNNFFFLSFTTRNRFLGEPVADFHLNFSFEKTNPYFVSI